MPDERRVEHVGEGILIEGFQEGVGCFEENVFQFAVGANDAASGF